MAAYCRNFSSLSELDNWCESLDKLQKSHAPLRQRHINPDSVLTPRLLLCHDFKGGYSTDEDEYFQGYFPHKTGVAYWARALALTDTFVYFSHKRVAIPPVTWVNGCHKSGVRCLGTIMFEHSQSTPDARKLLRLNASGIGYHYADLFVRVAKHYGFDGYLMNLEMTMENSQEARELINFIEYMKYRLHKVIGLEARVIWYDSLTTDNRLAYQNALNGTTLPFFNAADGLFTNYFWKERQVFDGAQLAGALYRLKLWTGVDVWGRNVQHPAKWQIGKALQKIENAGTSIALFAPAWVYEELGTRNFEKNDFSFWYDNVDKTEKFDCSVSSVIRPHPAPVLQTPDYQLFYTTFNIGHGTNFFINGRAEYPQAWVNHGLQTALPTFPHTVTSIYVSAYIKSLREKGITTALPGTFKTTWQLDNSKAFYGGSSLKFTSDPYNVSPYFDAIFAKAHISDSAPEYSGDQANFLVQSVRRKESFSQINASLYSKEVSKSSVSSVRRMGSSPHISVPRMFVTPLFMLELEIESEASFIFTVTFYKCADGDCKIRLSGQWQSCRDEDMLTDKEKFEDICTNDIVFEADLSGSVLNSWVRKSFTFQVGCNSLAPINGVGKQPSVFRLCHLDIACSENFSGSIYFGSFLLFDNHRSTTNTQYVQAPSRVTSVEISSYMGGRALLWRDDKEASEWIVYINDYMAGVASAPGWLLSSHLISQSEDVKVRIDAVGCGGAIVKGLDSIVSIQ
ncbi:glycosyl hydrolase family 85-domain-containing protein [Lipomyces arxii]|uniref:glycosyl hydrolase family 85-domain-containing protein n=1 Tax=Lipomyces arxii TaxID=56418 RepID=UPI0034CFBAFF